MAHRSNQAVASQEPPAPQAQVETPPARRFLIGWTTALAALGLSTAGVIVAIWLLRMPIAAFFIGAALAERGAEADFQVVNLGLDHATLADVRFGSEAAPDAAVARMDVRWSWRGLAPRLAAVHALSPRLRLRIDPTGRVSAGSLDRISGAPSQTHASIPQIDLTIEGGEALIEAPFGDIIASFDSSGRIGEDFHAIVEIAETTQRAQTHALVRGRANMIIASRNDTIAAQLTASAASLLWAGTTLEQADMRITARAPLDLSRYEAEAAWRIDALESASQSASHISGGAGGEAVTEANSLAPRIWQGQARINAASVSAYGAALQRMRFDARLDGETSRGLARWTLAGEDFAGFSLQAPGASASGELRFSVDRGAQGVARIALSRAHLNARAQDALARAFPDAPSTPVGPTFAHAERALAAAASRFDLVAPLGLIIDDNTIRLRIAAPIEARATTGALMRLAPLREDAPALVMQWPGAALHGAVSLELSGGGAPTTTLLLDTIDWSPDAPFEADGTLTLSDWSAADASIAANELGVSILAAPRSGGRVDLRGPLRITGPVGDGVVRDMTASLDVAITWNPGWRVTPNGCTPIQVGGFDAAGLSFANSALSLCPLDGAFIAADAARNLSGGFSIRDLALNGRMAGPSARSARLGATLVSGRFRGAIGGMTLQMDATAPRLQVEMDETRMLVLALQRATANAEVADGAWQVSGAFEHGALSDPALPGTITTIAGQWSARPQTEDGPIIEIASAEALLTANRPTNDNERPLFNPLRLANVNATVNGGAINATGDVVLESSRAQLAGFTALHDIRAGAGSAHIAAQSLVFGETLQPYQISERARGMVENVRGSASATADVAWTDETIAATGVISTPGVSFATATMPIVQDVSGSIYFDDLFTLTTPPGQIAAIGLINPGLAAHNGRVRFQLLPDQRVSIESAAFDFAGGVLAMAPTTVRLGEDETNIRLTLRNVDAADLIANLNIPDLAATGRVEGSFPLRLTRQSAFIEGGVLFSSGDGGVLSYTGTAGQNVQGFSRVAFDALRRFSYDSLALTLDGDLNGEVISSIEFSGRNSGRPVELGDMTDIPGVGSVTVRGVPFDFNVRITAPFRSLARTAAGIADPGQIISRANGEVAETETEIDIAPPQAPVPVDPNAPGAR